MKNELGIEVKCENCHINDYNRCMLKDFKNCRKNNFNKFYQSWEAMVARIKELQEQVEVLQKQIEAFKEIKGF